MLAGHALVRRPQEREQPPGVGDAELREHRGRVRAGREALCGRDGLAARREARRAGRPSAVREGPAPHAPPLRGRVAEQRGDDRDRAARAAAHAREVRVEQGLRRLVGAGEQLHQGRHGRAAVAHRGGGFAAGGAAELQLQRGRGPQAGLQREVVRPRTLR